jgi:predicted DNA-binding transcriptional regulator AlpA
MMNGERKSSVRRDTSEPKTNQKPKRKLRRRKMSNYMDDKELCTRLKLSRTTLWSLRKRGLPYKRIGGVIRYLAEDVDAWLEASCKGQNLNLIIKENES